ncbi:MAG: murein L,D-transpeptidase catalytic domain family protein [Pseudobdellovibrionaceae bacterium]
MNAFKIDRRSILKGAVATFGMWALPGAAAAATRATSPVTPIDQATTERLINRARREFERVSSLIPHHDKVAIADFSLASHRPRFFIIDMAAGKVKSYLVAHGRGSDPEHEGLLQHFSNRPGSFATSKGAYLTAQQYEGKFGTAMRLEGLDPTNNEAMDRAIVIHEAWYADRDMIRRYGKLGRSEGCFTVSPGLAREVIERLGSGRLLFADKLDANEPIEPAKIAALSQSEAGEVIAQQQPTRSSSPVPFYDF